MADDKIIVTKEIIEFILKEYDQDRDFYNEFMCDYGDVAECIIKAMKEKYNNK